jgi:valyl-tRNA synthetase
MSIPERYDPAEAEARWQAAWAARRLYEFNPADPRPLFVIDTPPPTVSGEITIGHVYSYTQAECMARYQRMRGHNVYYPFGFDDNGLPTERFVERKRNIRAHQVGRQAFVAACLETTHEIEARFEQFWRSLGFSVDWRLRYSTISPEAQRISQWSFLDLHRKGLIYRATTPNPWCIECRTAIAQAEIDDAERATTFYTITFRPSLPIATTRPELLPACVAIFVHPEDTRYNGLIGSTARVPLSERTVPILADEAVDPQKGTGAVMCCTFGDATDVAWWQQHDLPLIPLLKRDGRLSKHAGPYEDLKLSEARERILADLAAAGALGEQHAATQTVRVHERCGTPLEILQTAQWYVRILDAKEQLLAAGRQINWYPAHMHNRYANWVEGLAWDWCISRQRFYGVPFPAWHCASCGTTILADEAQLPLDPASTTPPRPCPCGGELLPDEDVMDTWATSSVSPQIAARMFEEPELYQRLFPMHLRPQGHDIIRTWAFYTIAKSLFHFGKLPWQNVMVSGHALDPLGLKISKSKNNAPANPTLLIERHSADALRYWACNATLGSDQPISEEIMRQGRRLINKLWSAGRLLAAAGRRQEAGPSLCSTTADNPASCILPADKALLSSLQRLISTTTALMERYEYAQALDGVERFFWGTFCDQYLELVKGRLYDGDAEQKAAALSTSLTTFEALLKLFAPFMPHICEELHHLLYAQSEDDSIHTTAYPSPNQALHDEAAEQTGAAITALVAATRRAKTARKLSLGTPVAAATIGCTNEALLLQLQQAAYDLQAVMRAGALHFATTGQGEELAPGLWLDLRL